MNTTYLSNINLNTVDSKTSKTNKDNLFVILAQIYFLRVESNSNEVFKVVFRLLVDKEYPTAVYITCVRNRIIIWTVKIR